MTRGLRARRWWWMVAGLCLGLMIAVFSRPVFHLAKFMSTDVDEQAGTPEGYMNDASRLNLTKVTEVWQVPGDAGAAERQLQQLLKRATLEGLRVSIAGARHSMGGHTIYPGGIVIDMLTFNKMSLDPATNILQVQAGALWSDIIPYLDRHRRSVAVMQSNNSFTVGGSISANCHGWQHNRPPISATVESFRLLKADGNIVRCSRGQNAELFSLALGGYGLFGIILDVDLHVVANERSRLEQVVIPTKLAMATLHEKIAERPDVQMVYARLNIVPDQLFESVILNLFYPDPDGEIPGLTERGVNQLRRAIFRGSAESDYGKELRWSAETKLQQFLAGRVFSRNQLLNEGVEVFQSRASDQTDILHEYFVPPRRVADFVEQMRQIIPRYKCDLLNVTVREVNTDEDTMLRYADQRMMALVMLFSQKRTQAAEDEMESLTRKLIDTALASEGRYYLPYRLHASIEQFHQAYPQARKFFELKRKYDRDELFQNKFYLKYGKK